MPKTGVSKSLELPHGYQKFSWYEEGYNEGGNHLNDPGSLVIDCESYSNERLYLYTQHQIFYQNGILKQTRSSPNWEGGVVTYSTCKHRMRTYDVPDWENIWVGGLCPGHCENNCLLFVGRVAHHFISNYHLGLWMREEYPEARHAKLAISNPRGDIYTPITAMDFDGEDQYDHNNFVEPENHTRSVEFYSRSPGSVSDREDGSIPKWWRDLEYVGAKGRRPPSFVLSPCYLFSKPLMWSSYNPRRAALKLTMGDFGRSLSYAKV